MRQAWLDAEGTLNTNLKAVVLPMAEHSFVGDMCDVCGGTDPDYVESIEKFILSGTDNYAVATIAREGGDANITIPRPQWSAKMQE